jgi:hypothetical protein
MYADPTASFPQSGERMVFFFKLALQLAEKLNN